MVHRQVLSQPRGSVVETVSPVGTEVGPSSGRLPVTPRAAGRIRKGRDSNEEEWPGMGSNPHHEGKGGAKPYRTPHFYPPSSKARGGRGTGAGSLHPR